MGWTSGSAEQRFSAPQERVFQAALNAAAKLRMKVTEADPANGRLSLRTRVSALSWGENVTLSITGNDDGTSTVALGSKVRLVTNVTAAGKHKKNFNAIAAAITEDLSSSS